MTTIPIEPVAFSVVYEGEALQDHSMAIRDVAPALLGLAQAFERANTILNGENANTVLELRATGQGSIEIALTLQQFFEQASRALPGGDFITTANELKNLLVGSSGGVLLGVIGLIKLLQGLKPKEVQRTADEISIESDGVVIRIPAKLFMLYGDSVVRNRLEEVVKPLGKEGVDRLLFKEGQGTIHTIEKSEMESFKGSLAGDGLTEAIFPRQFLKLALLNFSKNGKWKFSDGEKTHWYTITDQPFMDRVGKNLVRFGKGDILICDVRIRQSLNDKGDIRVDHEITRVIEHIRAPEQARIPEV